MSLPQDPEQIQTEDLSGQSHRESSDPSGSTISNVEGSAAKDSSSFGLPSGFKLGTIAALGIALTAVPIARAQGTPIFSDSTGTGDPGDPGGPVACDPNPDPGPSDPQNLGPIPDTAGGYSDPHGAPADPGGSAPPSTPAPS